MGRTAAKNAEIYVNEHNLSGRSNAFEMAVDNNLIDVSCFGDTGLVFVEGLYGAELRQNAFLDPDEAGIDEIIWDELGVAAAAMVGYAPIGTGTKGNVVYEANARPKEQVRPVEIAGALLLNVNWQMGTGIVRGILLQNEAVTASGVVAGTARELGATTSPSTFVTIIRCLAFDGTNLTVDIEESSNDGGGDAYELIAGMQQVITGVGSWRLTTTSSTEAWKRVNITAFTGISMTIMVVCGIIQGS